MQLNQIRKSFLDFFKSLDHTIISSNSLIPHHDPSLLFTNAGMVGFKNYFTGAEIPTFTRVASSQKCIRAGGKHNDLENVGYTARHHTFFEMLGNFSFLGDYFKEFAIEAAWKYLTEVLGIDKKKLYVTVYHEDEEAYKIWQKLTGFSTDKIIKIATNDNFWFMGDTGPCGPCSEIFFDHGEEYQGGLPGTLEEGGDRFVEIWNLVFMQYEQLSDGRRILLPKLAIDTGMGIERITAVMQGVNDNYDIDIFFKLREASVTLSKNKNFISSHKIIADHLRSSCFLIADDIMPSNEGRGYVLRRIMRRAMRHINLLGNKDLMMYKLVPVLIAEMGEAYPELKRAEAVITSVLQAEEERFSETLDRGLKILTNITEKLVPGNQLSGDIAFNLYDTYGFPLDLTKDILRSKSITVDENGFEKAMEAQRNRAKAAWVGSGEQVEGQIWHQLYQEYGATKFLGYEILEARARVLAIVSDSALVNSITNGNVIIITNQTPFYAEAGGQVGDTGLLNGNKVLDVKRYSQGVFGHYVEVSKKIAVTDEITLLVDASNRNKIKANHSATHLLHKVLRDVLGQHVSQKGSIVSAEKLRFDFSHNKQLTIEEITLIEEKVNQMIIENKDVLIGISTLQEAMRQGATALFGEKYGDEVRIVSMGTSIELCGGTHVARTGDIGYFKIVNEESVAAGIRRIEALTGLAAVDFSNTKQKKLKSLALLLKCSENEVENKINTLRLELKVLAKEVIQYKSEFLASNINIETKSDYILAHKVFYKEDYDNLKGVLEVVKKKYSDSLIFIINQQKAQAAVMIAVTGNALQHFKANELAKFFIDQCSGNGGGNKNLAQIGGCNYHQVIKVFEDFKNTAK